MNSILSPVLLDMSCTASLPQFGRNPRGNRRRRLFGTKGCAFVIALAIFGNRLSLNPLLSSWRWP